MLLLLFFVRLFFALNFTSENELDLFRRPITPGKYTGKWKVSDSSNIYTDSGSYTLTVRNNGGGIDVSYDYDFKVTPFIACNIYTNNKVSFPMGHPQHSQEATMGTLQLKANKNSFANFIGESCEEMPMASSTKGGDYSSSVCVPYYEQKIQGTMASRASDIIKLN